MVWLVSSIRWQIWMSPHLPRALPRKKESHLFVFRMMNPNLLRPWNCQQRSLRILLETVYRNTSNPILVQIKHRSILHCWKNTPRNILVPKLLAKFNETDLSATAMNLATSQGSVETFVVVHPADTNRYQGVYMYLDVSWFTEKKPSIRIHVPQRWLPHVVIPTLTLTAMCSVGRCPNQTESNPQRWFWSRYRYQQRRSMDETSRTRKFIMASSIVYQYHVNTTSNATAVWDGIIRDGSELRRRNRLYMDSRWRRNWDNRISSGNTIHATWRRQYLSTKSWYGFRFQIQSLTVRYNSVDIVRIRLYSCIDVDGCTWTIDNKTNSIVVTCEKMDSGKMWPRIQA